MSCNESKTVLRAEIPSLRGKDRGEVYKYFKPIIGEADDVDEFEGIIDYFHYDERNHDFVPVFEMSYGRGRDDKVGVDYILKYENDYGFRRGKVNHSIGELKKLSEMVGEKFNVSPDTVRIVSYTWYNGSDEPIIFGDNE